MKSIGICIPTIEGGVICHQEIGREAVRRGISYPQIVTHTPLYTGLKNSIKGDNFQSMVPLLSDSINRTAKAGAEFAIIPSNTPHIVFDDIATQSDIPILSILEVSADYCAKQGYKSVGILGTSITVKHGLYNTPLRKRNIISVYVSDLDQELVMNVIQQELIQGIFLEEKNQ